MDNYKNAIDELLIEIAKKIPQEHVKYPIKAYIVGGVANYLYTQARVSDDIDMILSHSAYNEEFEQCFQKYLNTFDKNIFWTLIITHSVQVL